MPSVHTLLFIREHQYDQPAELALQAAKYPDVDMPFAIRQIVGLRIIADKVPSWYSVAHILFPRHISLEQCSSEATARYKASLVSGDRMVDLTGGFGIDCAFLSEQFKQAIYVERQTELCDLAKHNFPTLGLDHIAVINQESEAFLKESSSVDLIFIDPARRDGQGGKTVAISDCEPDVAKLASFLLEKGRQVMIKLSPMLDLSLALRDMPSVRQVHIVSVNNECKELILLASAREELVEPTIYCVNMSRNILVHSFTFTKSEEQTAACAYASEVESYLYEPNASILKAGAYRSIASVYSLKKLHPNSHLYTSDQLIESFPGRCFRVVSSLSLHKKKVKDQLSDLRKANITIRNFPLSVAALRKRLKLEDGGEAYLFATTLMDERKVLIRCEKPSHQSIPNNQ